MHGCSGERGMHGCLGGCVVAPGGGGHVWLLLGGMHGFFRRGMHGFFWGACVIFPGGHAWFLPGVVRGFFEGACMVFSGGCVVFSWGGVHRIRRDTVNEQAVRILLECILL